MVTSALSTPTMKTRLALFAVYASGVALAFAGVLKSVYQLSVTDNSSSHVVLVPLISLALIYQRRQEIFSSVSFSVAAGSALIVASLALVLVVRVDPWGAGFDTVRPLAAVVVSLWIAGFLMCFGRQAFHEARFPLLFLLLMVPIPPVVLDGVTEILKRGSTEAVAALFTLTNTPYHREGFVFSLPTVAIEVADACSGIRSSIALVLTALIAGHLTLERTSRKVLLVLAVFPVTILKNAIRIVSLSLLATHVNPSFLVGRLHHDGGVVFFLMALAMLAPVLGILRRSETTSGLDRPRAALSS
jgi:exosortase